MRNQSDFKTIEFYEGYGGAIQIIRRALKNRKERW